MEAVLDQKGKMKVHADLITGPHQVCVDITNKCNLRCLHCFNRSAENMICDNELSDKEMISLFKDITQFKPMNVCFCGGEPLLRKKLLLKIIPILKRCGSQISMVSNGLLFDRQTAHELKELGIDRIQFSLDGKRAESHDRLRAKKGSFDKTIQAIKIAIESKYSNVAIAYTPTQFNIDEVEDAFTMLYDMGVDTFRLQPLMALGRAQENIRRIEPQPMQYRRLVATVNRLKHEYGPQYIQWGDPVDHLIRFRSYTSGLVNHLFIRANGDIVPSTYLPLVVGNIRKHSILQYWNHGLVKIWEAERVKKMASAYFSNKDLGKKFSDQPDVWFEKDIVLDLIDDNILN